MTIPFKNIPSNLRVPLFYAEVDNSQANTATDVQRTLVIGQMTASGTGAAGTVMLCQGSSDAQTLAGVNSRLAADVAAYRQADSAGELWIGLLADDPGAQAATGTVTFSGAPTAAGTFYLYLGGVRYALAVATTQTPAQIATALAALVNADVTCPVSAAAAAAVVTFTADSKGPQGNDYPIFVSFYGVTGGEPTVPGLTATISPMAGGTTTPSLTALLSALGDKSFDFIHSPYTDTATLDTLKLFLNDTAGRWSWTQQLYGHVFAMLPGTLSALVTFGDGRNNQHESISGVYRSPTPMSQWAATWCAAAAASARNDPAQPLQTLALPGVIAPALADRFDLTDRNTLLYNGISTFTVADDGTVAIENTITTYQKNGFGAADNSYLEVETMFTLMAVLRSLKNTVTSKYARVKLADNGTTFAPGSPIVTPNTVRADLISTYKDLETQGLVQAPDVFAANLIVQRNAVNPNRLDFLYPPALIDQLRVFAGLLQFRLLV